MITPHRKLTTKDYALYEQVRHFAEALEAAGHALATEYRAAVNRADSQGRVVVDRAELRRLREQLLALPEAELRRLFNGWLPRREWSDARTIADEFIRMRVGLRPIVSIERCDVAPTGFVAEPSEEFCATRGAVEVHIAEGADRATVMRDLYRIAGLIERNWARIQKDPATAFAAVTVPPAEEPKPWSRRDAGVPPYEAEVPRGHLASYRPELATWFDDSTGKDIDERSLFIRERRTDGTPGRRIATMVINEQFPPKVAERIGSLFAMAPALWRMLRDAARSQLGEFETLDSFSEAVKLLWNAAGRNPYGHLPNDSDEDIYRRDMAIEAAGHRVAERREGGAA